MRRDAKRRSAAFSGGAVVAGALIVAAATQALAQSRSSADGADIRLLKHPYPYRAALTVCSDTHGVPVEQFEAVHALINLREPIKRGSEAWQYLFGDPEIDKRADWREGIDGFGFPFGDTMWLYDPSIGVFAGFDERTGQPVPHAYKGRDFREIIDEWFRRGWVDSLHTPGVGHIPREATAAGLRWLQERPHRRLKVWVNHSLSTTPTCIGPDQSALRPVINNITKCGTAVMCWVGLERLARAIAQRPYPVSWPAEQRASCWLLSILLVGSGTWLLLSVIIKRLRKRVSFIVAGLVLVGTLGVLSLMPLRRAQGDNPDSPLYHADLVRQAGFRYYWLIVPLPGQYRTLVSGTLALPERSCGGGRPSCLRVVELDDGASCLTFGRNTKKGWIVEGSLSLLTEENLEALCEKQSTSIIYIHWAIKPKLIFVAEVIDNLARLRRFNEAGRVWLACTSELLHFTFVRAFLEYRAHQDQGKRVIEIVRVNDPTGEPFTPTLEDLRGISFDCPGGEPIEVRLAGEPLGKDALDILAKEGRQIVRFPLRPMP